MAVRVDNVFKFVIHVFIFHVFIINDRIIKVKIWNDVVYKYGLYKYSQHCCIAEWKKKHFRLKPKIEIPNVPKCFYCVIYKYDTEHNISNIYIY